MPKQISEQKQTILAVLKGFPDGASAEEIGRGLSKRPPHRTLQRRLALLVREKKLTVQGRGRASRYRFPTIVEARGEVAGRAVVEGRGEARISLSPEGEALEKNVRAALQNRQPVGYKREFLDTYRPNETYYLPADTRQRLLNLGRAPDSERPAGTYARQIFNRLLIDLSWNSSRLEGNTYSLLETERLLQLGESAEGKNAQEAQMILNHKAAIELLVEQAADIAFNRYTVLNLHALLSDNLFADPRASGRLRAIPVAIDGSTYHPLEVPQLVEECFQQILDTATAITDPFEQAFFAMVHLPYLQPFVDVNKRVSRLAANIPLIRQNLSPLSFIDVPQRLYIDGLLSVYELNRVELLRDVFVWAYERSSARYTAVRQSLGEPDPFRLRYRSVMIEIVGEVVRAGMNKKAAATFIRRHAVEQVVEEDRARFIEVVETELTSLHEGNIARYRLRPTEYQSWHQTWH